MSRTGFDRRDLAAIALGGVLGASLRWLITDTGDQLPEGGWFAYAPNTGLALEGPGFPWRTLVVNVLGCALLGAVFALRGRDRNRTRLLLASGTGFCGSLTTFSSFAVEVTAYLRGPIPIRSQSSVNYLVADPSTPARAVVYVVASLVAGALAFLAGRSLAGRPPDSSP